MRNRAPSERGFERKLIALATSLLLVVSCAPDEAPAAPDASGMDAASDGTPAEASPDVSGQDADSGEDAGGGEDADSGEEAGGGEDAASSDASPDADGSHDAGDEDAADASHDVVAADSPTLLTLNVLPPSVAIGPPGQQFNAIGEFDDGATVDLTASAVWSSSDDGVLIVSNDAATRGFATPVASGFAEVRAEVAQVAGFAHATVSVDVVVAIEVSPANATAAPNCTQQFAAVAMFNDGSTADVTAAAAWTSGSLSTATVDGTGLATGVAPGTTTISATHSGLEGTASFVVVSPALYAVSIEPSTATIPVAETQQFSAIAHFASCAPNTQDVTSVASWSSSDTAVATVGASDGKATAVGAGTAEITGSWAGFTPHATLVVVSP